MVPSSTSVEALPPTSSWSRRRATRSLSSRRTGRRGSAMRSAAAELQRIGDYTSVDNRARTTLPCRRIILSRTVDFCFEPSTVGFDLVMSVRL